MAITSAICTSFKVELLKGVHNFTATTGNTFKIALYDSDATLGASTTAFSTSEEITNTSGTAYTSGGATLTSVTPVLQAQLQFVIFHDVSFSSASFTANGALIYNSSASNAAVCAIAFGSDKTATNGTFTIQFPTADANKRNHKISIGGPLCRFLQDGVDSPGAKRIGTVMLYLQLVGVQKHGTMVSGEILQTKQFH